VRLDDFVGQSVNVPFNFRVESRDSFGNVVETSCSKGRRVVVSVALSKNKTAALADHVNAMALNDDSIFSEIVVTALPCSFGLYPFSARFDFTGAYTISVSVDGIVTATSPFDVSVPAETVSLRFGETVRRTVKRNRWVYFKFAAAPFYGAQTTAYASEKGGGQPWTFVTREKKLTDLYPLFLTSPLNETFSARNCFLCRVHIPPVEEGAQGRWFAGYGGGGGVGGSRKRMFLF
jgi:hypothetical protein